MASLGNYGIMTLSRGPYNELDKMSLFQDLKLKRRKVDSRCSSDGESLADTSTSSPDLPPLSPKMCDASPQQGNTNQTSIGSHQSQSTSSTPPPLSSSPPETTSTEDHETTITTLTNIKRDSPLNDGHENPSTTTNDHNSHIHPNGSTQSSGISVIIENRPRSHSPAPSSPIRRSPVNTLLQQTLTQPLIPSSESNSQHVTVLVTPPRIKTETHHLMNAMTRKLPPVSNIPSIDCHSLPITAPMSGLSQLQHHHQINQVQIPFTSAASTTAIASGFKRNITGQISPNHPHNHHHPYPIDQRIKRERSPNSHLTIIPQPNNQMRQPQQQPLSPHQIPISSAAAAVFHGSPLQMRSAQGIREATMLFRIKNESQMAMPPGFLPSAPPQRMMWGPQARINGVKPEVIGGPLPPLRQQVSPQSSPQQQTSPKHNNSNNNKARATPTVIMGESCGVRTMVWGFEPVMSPQNQQQQPQVQNLNSPVQSPPGTSQSSNHSTSSNLSSNNEEAAHLLLSLGQGVRPIIENRARAINRPPHALNMERLWAGDYSQLPAGQQMHALNLSAQQQTWMGQHQLNKEHGGIDDITNEEDDQPLVCMICEDKATGLHYGIITCEGCKGFFKRTVQNRRVYTCVADGTCEITKAQRNRCQYCRFKKCIEQGMVLQAVREDRMPGGRNSGAVYNLYKVKYKKHKKNNAQKGNGASSGKNSGSNSDSKSTSPLTTNVAQPQPIKQESLPPPSLNGNILKTALTNPSEINHLRHRIDNAVSSSRDRSISFENALNMIQALIDCDAMEDIATLPHFSQFLEDKSEISDKLCNIGDSIVHKLVSWTKKLPFYLEIPVEIHTKLLTDKWHEILVLTTATYQAMHGRKFTQPQQTPPTSIAPDKHDPEFIQEVNAHLQTLQTCLTTLMGHSISMEQLKLDVGLMVEKMTQITIMFRRIKLRMEEYVCLKVYILLNREVELESIQERYIQVLRSYLQHTSPHNPGRLSELLAHIPEIQTAANLLLESKMFYVPFVLNSATTR